MARFLIVDAHSIIFAWPELRALHQRRMALAREALVQALTHYQDFSGVRVVAVFDGQGQRAADAGEPGGVQVIYSGQGETADDVIERLVARYGQEHEITVATRDRLEAQTASTFGATCISPDFLWGMLGEARAGFERDLKRHQRQ
jgi:predicted RNA-binding protein with PIN domain